MSEDFGEPAVQQRHFVALLQGHGQQLEYGCPSRHGLGDAPHQWSLLRPGKEPLPLPRGIAIDQGPQVAEHLRHMLDLVENGRRLDLLDKSSGIRAEPSNKVRIFEQIIVGPEDEKDRASVRKEGPVYEVRLTKPFYLGKYEVTQTEWKAVMDNSPSKFSDNDRNPVDQVSWDDCQAFMKRLNTPIRPSPPLRSGASSQTPTPLLFALPTEAQWECACRAGTQTRFYFGDDLDYKELSEYAWFRSGLRVSVSKRGYRVGSTYSCNMNEGWPAMDDSSQRTAQFARLLAVLYPGDFMAIWYHVRAVPGLLWVPPSPSPPTWKPEVRGFVRQAAVGS